jgi:hypothetical protein
MGKSNKLIDDGGSAYPVPCAAPFGSGHMATGGMSVRTYIAAKALAAYNSDCNVNITSSSHEKATWALADADALLALLKRDSRP